MTKHPKAVEHMERLKTQKTEPPVQAKVASAVEILPGDSQPMSQGHQQDLPTHS